MEEGTDVFQPMLFMLGRVMAKGTLETGDGCQVGLLIDFKRIETVHDVFCSYISIQVAEGLKIVKISGSWGSLVGQAESVIGRDSLRRVSRAVDTSSSGRTITP